MEGTIISKIGSILGIAAIFIVVWKLFIELPKAFKAAKSVEEKISALTIML